MPSRNADGSRTTRPTDNREFLKSALTIGGPDALDVSRAFLEPSGLADAEPVTVADRGNRQHAWVDAEGGRARPGYHVLLCLEYRGDGEPTAGDRLAMEGALRQLERAFEWRPAGLLFAVGYSRRYFERFDEVLPAGVDLRDDEAVIEALSVGDEEPEPEPYDALVHLASDNPTNVLAAESALWGDRDELEGVPVERSFEGVFDRPHIYPDRRAGFVGEGEPAERMDNADIPADAPLSMGFDAGDDGPSTEEVTVTGPDAGAYAGGTVLHASRLDVDLDGWYDRSRDERADRMLGDDGAGHADRFGDGGPTIAPRQFNTTDDGRPGTYFLATMPANGEMVRARRAMNRGDDGSADGLVEFIETRRRGNFLVPPLSMRSLPPARAARVSIDVAPGSGDDPDVALDGDVVSVVVRGPDALLSGGEEPLAVRFGPPRVVERADGAKPVDHDFVSLDAEEEHLVLHFRTGDAGFEESDSRARLFALTAGLDPVLGETDVAVE